LESTEAGASRSGARRRGHPALGQEGLAAGKKNASRLNAHLVFLDESGLLLAPLVRRTWAPCGETPILYQRGRHREKVSIIAALSVSPRRRRVGLYFSMAAHLNVEAEWLVIFLRGLLRHLRGNVILIWDNLSVHRAGVVQRFLHRHPRARIEFLPPYAPELNPVEGIWSHLKMNPLANLAPHDADDLARVACRHVENMQRRHRLLRSMIRRTDLSL
jgi:transposase